MNGAGELIMAVKEKEPKKEFKTESINIRVTPTELETILQAREAAGMGIREFIVWKCTGVRPASAKR